jgi:hypothetical protein
MRLPDVLRYGLWCATLATARANRRVYRMPTTWAPHLALNTAALLLPDLVRLLRAAGHQSDRSAVQSGNLQSAIWQALAAVADENPAYVWRVAPFTAGYLTSHPRCDIYKGPLGELRLAGFGLDAIPHALTALSLSLLLDDTLRAAAESYPGGGPVAHALRVAAERPALASGLVLALLTLLWETGEWLALRYELGQRGDPALINMQWSVPDMLRDCVANAAGWAAACALRGRIPDPKGYGYRG